MEHPAPPLVVPSKQPPLLDDEYSMRRIDAFKQTLAARQQKPYHSLPKDLSAHVYTFLLLPDLFKLRRVSRVMERHLSQLPLSLRFPRSYTPERLLEALLMFPNTRIVSFSPLSNINVPGWRVIFSVIASPVLDLRNVSYTIHLDGAGAQLFELGHYKQALQCYQRALELAPNEHVHLHNIAVCLLELGQYNQALVSFQEILRTGDKDIKTRSRYGLCLSHLGKTEEAMEVFNSILSENANAVTQARRADLHAQLGNNANAIADYSRCVAELQDPEIFAKFGQLLRDHGDSSDASKQEQLAADLAKVPSNTKRQKML